jgi:hypothetical protein
MKFLKTIFVVVLLTVSSLLTSAQGQNEIPSKLTSSFKKGDSFGLSNFFGDRVELTILDKEAIYSKSQAKQIMAKFFREFQPTDFKKKHTGSKTGSRYATAELYTKKGKFRVSFLLKKQNGKFMLHQLNIEKD